MTTIHWTLSDGAATPETFTFSVNPNSMTTPFQPRNTTDFGRMLFHPAWHFGGSHRIWRLPNAPFDWQFSGIVYTQDDYLKIRHWVYGKSGIMTLTDHFDRSYQVRLKSFEPTQHASARFRRTPWRHTFVIKCLLYGNPTDLPTT